MSAARNFTVSKLKLHRIYESKIWQGFPFDPFQVSAVPAEPDENPSGACSKIDKVYGPFRFPGMPSDRAYTFGSFVMSVDGCIAFPENRDGSQIAKNNRLDPGGALCDYWILNLLRSVSGAVILGSASLSRERYLTGEIFDDDLIACRTDNGMPAVPLHVVLTRRGKNLALDHQVFRNPNIPVVIAASSEGARIIGRKYGSRVRFLGNIAETAGPPSPGGLYAMAAEMPAVPLLAGFGSGTEIDAGLLLGFLRRGGCDKALIESPSFMVRLMQEKLLDEMFLNTSGIFIGGDSLLLGSGSRAFTAEDHPHTRVLTIHTHSDSFFYHRYMLDYSETE